MFRSVDNGYRSEHSSNKYIFAAAMLLYDIGKIGGRSYLVAFYEVQLLTESLEEASYATVPGIHANFYMWLFFAICFNRNRNQCKQNIFIED